MNKLIPYYTDQKNICKETVSGSFAQSGDDSRKSNFYEVGDKKRKAVYKELRAKMNEENGTDF